MGKGSSNGEFEDSKSVIGLIEESKAIVMIFQYFIVSFFHYDATTLDFAEFLENNPFGARGNLLILIILQTLILQISVTIILYLMMSSKTLIKF